MVRLSNSKIIGGTLGLVGPAAAHMIMNTPTPYDSHKLSTSPLGPASGGADAVPFPCHGNFDVTEVTNATAGTTQTVKFTGSAVHGGGSCQFSVNYGDTPSDDPADWKVIYTIIGGCPAVAEGNIEGTAPNDEDGRPDGIKCGDSSGKECVRQFDIPLPKDLPNGKFSFAWTWFNKIGNREMYMSCAPMVMTGGSDATTFVDSLPSIFVANVEGFAQCTTDNGIINIPNPGKAGAVLDGPFDGNEGTCEKADAPNFDKALSGALGGGSDDSSSGSGSGSGSGSDSGASSSSTAASTPSSSAAGVFVSNPPATTMKTVTTSTSPSSSAVPDATSSSSSGGGYSTGDSNPSWGQVPCSEDGALVCLEPGYFGICNHGSTVPMQLAAGTTCQGGKIVRRSA